MDKRIASVRHTRAKLATVNRIPEEILVLIFHHYTMPRNQIWKDIFKDLHRLSQVCKHWAKIVHDTPSMWAELDGSFTSEEWERNLRKSVSHPLFVHIDFSNHVEPGLLDAVTTEVKRWHSLWYKGTRPNSNLASLQASPAPSLEWLSLSGDSENEVMEIDVDAIHAPRLKEVRFWHAVPQSWNSSIFHKLRSLVIENLPAKGPQISHLWSTLEACPDLETFRLERVEMKEIDLTRRPRITLNNLKTLELESLRCNVMECFLADLDVPRCTRQAVKPKDRSQSLLDTIVSQVTSSQYHHLQSCRTIHVAVKSGPILNLTLDEVYTFAVDLKLWSTDEDIEAPFGLADILPRLPVADMSTKVVAHISSETKWTTEEATKWFRGLRCAEELVFHNWSCSTDDALEALSTPGPDGEWCCPSLKTITVEDCSPAAVLKLVQERAVQQATKQEQAVKLTGLVIKTVDAMNRKTFLKLQGIIGDGAQWEHFDASPEEVEVEESPDDTGSQEATEQQPTEAEPVSTGEPSEPSVTGTLPEGSTGPTEGDGTTPEA